MKYTVQIIILLFQHEFTHRVLLMFKLPNYVMFYCINLKSILWPSKFQVLKWPYIPSLPESFTLLNQIYRRCFSIFMAISLYGPICKLGRRRLSDADWGLMAATKRSFWSLYFCLHSIYLLLQLYNWLMAESKPVIKAFSWGSKCIFCRRLLHKC